MPPLELTHTLPLPSSPPLSMIVFPAGPLQAHPFPTQLPHSPDVHSAPLLEIKTSPRTPHQPPDEAQSFSLSSKGGMTHPTLLSALPPIIPTCTHSPFQQRRTPHSSSPGPSVSSPHTFHVPLPFPPAWVVKPQVSILVQALTDGMNLDELPHLSERQCPLLKKENNIFLLGAL